MGTMKRLIVLAAILLCGSTSAFCQGFTVALHPYVVKAHCENKHWVLTVYSVTEIQGVTGLQGPANQPVYPLWMSLLGIPTIYNLLKNLGVDDAVQLQNVTTFTQKIGDLTTPIECDPSDDGKGGDLPNSNSAGTVDAFTPTTGGLANKPSDAGPEAGTNYLTSYQFFFRALPFAPIYLPDLVNNLPACDPSNNRNAFVVNHTSGTVTRLNSCSGQIVQVIPVTSRPLQVAITPDKSLALVTSFDNAVSFISTASNQVVQTVRTNGNPSGIAITPDGAFAYVTSFNGSDPAVLVLDIAKRQFVATIPVSTFPQSIFLTPDGSTAYITYPFGDRIEILDTLTNTVTAAIAIPATFGVAFNSTGTLAYITSAQAAPGRVVILNTSTYDIIQSVSVGNGPTDVRVTPDDEFILVNNYFDPSDSVISARTKQVQTFPLPGKPRGSVFVQ